MRQLDITLYRNGFTVGDGPLRDMQTPDNSDFLASLLRGEVPRELAHNHSSPMAALNVTLKDKRSEDYTAPPAPAYVAFSGPAATLGAVAGSSGGVVFSTASLAAVALDDNSGASTLVQVRTADNKKLKIK